MECRRRCPEQEWDSVWAWIAPVPDKEQIELCKYDNGTDDFADYHGDGQGAHPQELDNWLDNGLEDGPQYRLLDLVRADCVIQLGCDGDGYRR